MEANVKGRTKEFSWLAKVLRAEAGPANYARFQVPRNRSLGAEKGNQYNRVKALQNLVKT